MDGRTALLLMRAKREREESEIAAPHKEAAMRSAQIANQERRAREGLERLLQSKLLPHVMEEVGRNVGRGLFKEIMKAVVSQKSFTGTTTLQLPTGMLVGADPESIVGRVIDWWKSSVAPKMSVRYDADVVDQTAQVVDIRLPEMGYRQPVYDRF